MLTEFSVILFISDELPDKSICDKILEWANKNILPAPIFLVDRRNAHYGGSYDMKNYLKEFNPTYYISNLIEIPLELFLDYSL